MNGALRASFFLIKSTLSYVSAETSATSCSAAGRRHDAAGNNHLDRFFNAHIEKNHIFARHE
jgi:hypothetical protein